MPISTSADISIVQDAVRRHFAVHGTASAGDLFLVESKVRLNADSIVT